MRNKDLFEQFMKENGIEYDVPFTAEFKYGNTVKTKEFKLRLVDYRDICCELVEAYTDGPVINEEQTLFMLLFSDNVRIIKEPWKPKKNEGYWYVWWLDSELMESFVERGIWENHSADFTRYIIGNCFKTEKEAIKHKDDIARVLRGEALIKWEDTDED